MQLGVVLGVNLDLAVAKVDRDVSVGLAALTVHE
jgi:hypothetical protein